MNISPQMEKNRLAVQGRTVTYSSRGPTGAPFVYVGVNGLMGGGNSFWPVIEGVPDSWRVLLPDLPGCGDSETLAQPAHHNIEGYTRWLTEFLVEAGAGESRIVLASVATGAPISVRFASENPERVAGVVFHLPFLGKPAISAKWARPVVAYSLLMPQVRKVVDRLRRSDRIMHRIILHEPPDAIPELAERDIDHKQQADLTAAGELLHDLMLTDARAELKFLRSPVLILASEHDFSAPLPLLEEIVRDRPERRLYVYGGGQHSWNEEFIDSMNAELYSFLRTL